MINKNLKNILALWVSVIVVGFLAFSIIGSPFISGCYEANNADKYYQYYSNYPWVFFILGLGGIRCSVHFIHTYESFFVVMATIAIAVYTWRLWVSTNRLWKASEQQSKDMDRAIKASERSAQAAEISAGQMGLAEQREIRAYLHVLIGEGGLYQERDKGFKFVARPILVNYGKTPAYGVGYVADGHILNIPFAPGYKFPKPQISPEEGSTMGPTQNFTLFAGMQDFVDDSLVENIKSGIDIGFFISGTIFYRDIFGKPHYTHFGQKISWTPDGKISGLYIQGENDAD